MIDEDDERIKSLVADMIAFPNRSAEILQWKAVFAFFGRIDAVDTNGMPVVYFCPDLFYDGKCGRASVYQLDPDRRDVDEWKEALAEGDKETLLHLDSVASFLIAFGYYQQAVEILTAFPDEIAAVDYNMCNLGHVLIYSLLLYPKEEVSFFVNSTWFSKLITMLKPLMTNANNHAIRPCHINMSDDLREWIFADGVEAGIVTQAVGVLNLSRLNLSVIPDWIYRVTDLTLLDLSDNKIDSIPSPFIALLKRNPSLIVKMDGNPVISRIFSGKFDSQRLSIDPELLRTTLVAFDVDESRVGMQKDKEVERIRAQEEEKQKLAEVVDSLTDLNMRRNVGTVKKVDLPT